MKKYVWGIAILVILIVLVAVVTFWNEDIDQAGGGKEANPWESAEALDLTESISTIEDCKEYSVVEISRESGNVSLMLYELESVGVPRRFWDCALTRENAEGLPSEEDVNKLRLLNGKNVLRADFVPSSCRGFWEIDYSFHSYGANFRESEIFELYECGEEYYFSSTISYGPRSMDATIEIYQIDLDQGVLAVLS